MKIFVPIRKKHRKHLHSMNVHIVFDFSDKHAASDCVIQENSSQKLNVMAKFEQPQLSSGCIVPQTDISR